MRFTAAAVFLAAGAMAGSVSTDYTTNVVTVTSCGPEVTDCPADSTKVETSTTPLTTSTVYTTNVHTLTQCGPEVPDCPAHSTIYSTETIAVSTTICPVTEVPQKPTQVPQPPVPSNGTVPGVPTHQPSTWVVPSVVPTPSNSVGTPAPPAPTAPTVPTGGEVCVPSHSVTAITKSYTTVLTSVEYSTIEVPCSTEVPTTIPSVSFTQPPAAGNTTVPPTQPPTGAAAGLTGSVFFAAAAGIAAFVLV